MEGVTEGAELMEERRGSLFKSTAHHILKRSKTDNLCVKEYYSASANFCLPHGLYADLLAEGMVNFRTDLVMKMAEKRTMS